MHTLPALDYKFDALEPHIDAKTMEIHHDKHHQAYIDKLNAALEGKADLAAMSVEELLQNIDKVPAEIRQAVINHGGGHANHSLFWKILTPGGENKPVGKLAEEIDKTFGSFEKFKEEFTAKALGQFGSGWAWLACEKGGVNLHIASLPNQESPLIHGHFPVLGVDVWEHAYYLNYQNRRADYVTAWWNVINWTKVNEIYESYK